MLGHLLVVHSKSTSAGQTSRTRRRDGKRKPTPGSSKVQKPLLRHCSQFFFLKQTLQTLWPVIPPNLKAGYSTLPTTSNSLPPNHPFNSSSVQLQLVTSSNPPFFTNPSAFSRYPSHTLLPCPSVSALKLTASNVPLSSTTSQPSIHCGGGAMFMISHCVNSMPPRKLGPRA